MATMQNWTGFEPHHYFHITTRNSIRDRISSASSGSLGKWSIAALDNYTTATAGLLKTDHESLLLVVTGNMQCRKIEADRPTLQSCLDTEETLLNQQSDGDHYLLAIVGSPSIGWQPTEESPTLTSSAWLQSPSAETKKSGKRFAVMYRSATGDRIYSELAPTLRSLANTDGKHQSGSGAWKVVEYRGEEYAVPDRLPDECSALAATEAYIKTGNRPRRLKDGLHP